MEIFRRMRSTRGETLVSVIIGVVILSILSAAIANILFTNLDLEDTYDRNNNLLILKSNATNILRGTDTSMLGEKETFAIYRDSVNHQFTVFTGATNVAQYKYINQNGDYVATPTSHTGRLYNVYYFVDKNESSFGKKNQIVKVGLQEILSK